MRKILSAIMALMSDVFLRCMGIELTNNFTPRYRFNRRGVQSVNYLSAFKGDLAPSAASKAGGSFGSPRPIYTSRVLVLLSFKGR